MPDQADGVPSRPLPTAPVDDAGAPTAELAGEIVELASRLGLRMATAESLTGGLLAAAIVDVPGASRAFSGGVVAYDTALKASLLGVDGALLRERGPVDGAVAEQMASGVRRACAIPVGAGEVPRDADIGISTTGVAGPDPDPQSGQAAGTVWLGVSSARGMRSELLGLSQMSRGEIRARTVAAALALVLHELRDLQAELSVRFPGGS